jgi:hypothetical protein
MGSSESVYILYSFFAYENLTFFNISDGFSVSFFIAIVVPNDVIYPDYLFLTP